MSPIAYPAAAHKGPHRIPHTAIGRKPKPILTKGSWTDKNLVRIISRDIRNAVITSFKSFSLFCINKLLSKCDTTLPDRAYSQYLSVVDIGAKLGVGLYNLYGISGYVGDMMF